MSNKNCEKCYENNMLPSAEDCKICNKETRTRLESDLYHIKGVLFEIQERLLSDPRNTELVRIINEHCEECRKTITNAPPERECGSCGWNIRR